MQLLACRREIWYSPAHQASLNLAPRWGSPLSNNADIFDLRLRCSIMIPRFLFFLRNPLCSCDTIKLVLHKMWFTVAYLLPLTSVFVLATPASEHSTSKFSSGKSKWSVSAKWNSNARPNGPLALHHALSKYQFPIPANLQRACGSLISHAERKTKRSRSAPAVYLEDDRQIVIPVEIGDRSNPQTVNLDFDTGSADLWVYSDRLPVSQQLSGHNIFKSHQSKSFTLDPTLKWKITYGDQSRASGSVGFDAVSVGDTVVVNQAIGLAEHLSSHFQEDKGSDGLLGLAFGHINTITPVQQKTFFENAMDSLDEKIFTVDLKHEQDGTYDFGFLDHRKYTSEIKFVPVDKTNGFWEFESNFFSLDDGQTTNRAPATAIADTGTSLLLVSEKVAEAYYDIFPEAILDTIRGGYTFPCSSQPPSFTVYVGKYPVTIPSHLLKYAPIEEGSETCFGGLQAIPEGKVSGSGSPTTYVFGEVFLKACFAVFDYGTDGRDARFGFAPKADANVSTDGEVLSDHGTSGEEALKPMKVMAMDAHRKKKVERTGRGVRIYSAVLNNEAGERDDDEEARGRYIPVHDEFKRGL